MTTAEYGRPVLPDPVEVAIAGEEKAQLRLQRQRERREREQQAQKVRGEVCGQAVVVLLLFMSFCDTSVPCVFVACMAGDDEHGAPGVFQAAKDVERRLLRRRQAVHRLAQTAQRTSRCLQVACEAGGGLKCLSMWLSYVTKCTYKMVHL